MKRLSFSIILILLIIAASDMPQAKVKGVCSNCHTMHNSQGGGPMAQTLTSPTWGWEDDATPNPSLLIYSCVGCHTRVGSSTTIDNDFPIVFNTQSPTNPLAGGNFHYLIGDDASGHNVVGITSPDTNFSEKNIPGSATSYAENQVTCAGTKGCHGDRGASDQLDAMKGAHHTNDAGGITAASIGLSYRFLDGILGTEDDDWEQNDGNTTHNEYKGATSPGTTTISSLCGKCHGAFHTSAGSPSPWLRHPTDAVLPDKTPDTEYEAYTTYNMLAPVARQTPNTSSDEVNHGSGGDVVMCLSCHRAHGSPYYKMIRWDYANSSLSTALEGCVVCHTSKN